MKAASIFAAASASVIWPEFGATVNSTGTPRRRPSSLASSTVTPRGLPSAPWTTKKVEPSGAAMMPKRSLPVGASSFSTCASGCCATGAHAVMQATKAIATARASTDLPLADLHLAPLDRAARQILRRDVAELKADRPLRILAVAESGRLHAVQNEYELIALRCDQ